MLELMAATRSSATACWAKSWLVQWVMCNPLATGSRQASSTIWARWRGGNLLGTSRAGLVQQELAQPTLLVASADAPDGGPIALQPGGEIADPLPGGDGQDDAGMLHLAPGQATTVGDGLQDRGICCRDGQRARSSTTHEEVSEMSLSSAQPRTRIC